MQVIRFGRDSWCTESAVKVAPNIRMGCEILRYYLRVEHRNWFPRARTL